MPPVLPKPVIGPVTSTFGYRPPLSFHNGQDYGWLYADPVASRRVYAPIGGRVTTGRNSLIGNYVFLPMGGGWRTRLTHFDSLAVRNGQTVSAGQYIGFMGNDGLQAQGVHLHVDVYDPQGIRRNPAHYYSNTFVLNGPGFAGAGQEIDMIDDNDINKIASAVWRFSMNHAGADTTTNAATHLAYGRRDASVASANSFEALEALSEVKAALLSLTEAVSSAPGSSIDMAPMLEAISRIPTAEQNGQAARDAIVK